MQVVPIVDLPTHWSIGGSHAPLMEHVDNLHIGSVLNEYPSSQL